ncbi:MAG: hypothetical protein A2845_01755 [Candidatus Lloydbacteria bacterium RIFCSPHIGHO2_01_FULL_49_22]|uniref:DUF475 domain-containing protein n=1 Tax=Candidatus Lloydbacteria bacterium RIFCSPHIGHO2_01_FULL_49_22 TaxID=1798658 RepID=A0A1G2CZS5_9BACT|nr:MAG: hypothetical protein A2845_01755 [Candidatus Lloydbacteria bacterium RIFCSPHIGHO2_01_FULL_49_22]OGZ10044.1 MAG: hypothetical protein A3C14_04920 [Candidatus Lloydbacteria bacterium RIFCSPHIGHO2_02_FULL_50_18]
MEIFNALLIIAGLVVFESINSVDNAVINAEVLGTVGPKAKKWFLTWGMFYSVFLVRGLLPLFIVWVAIPGLSLWGAFTATFSSDNSVAEAVERSSPILLMGAGVFLLFLFLHWLFLETKEFGLHIERFFLENGLWFYATISIILATIVWYSVNENPFLAFGAVVGSSAFFIVNGFKENAERAERSLKNDNRSDMSKIVYLQLIDSAFSVDGVLGAFAFTLSVPLILIGNGIGALVVRWITIANIENIKKYIFLKHGAMYSLLFLGLVMIADGFHIAVPQYVSPIITFVVIGYFFAKSKRAIHITIT